MDVSEEHNSGFWTRARRKISVSASRGVTYVTRKRTSLAPRRRPRRGHERPPRPAGAPPRGVLQPVARDDTVGRRPRDAPPARPDAASGAKPGSGHRCFTPRLGSPPREGLGAGRELRQGGRGPSERQAAAAPADAHLAAAAAAFGSEGERLAGRAARQTTRPRHPTALRRLRDDAREEALPRRGSGPLPRLRRRPGARLRG